VKSVLDYLIPRRIGTQVAVLLVASILHALGGDECLLFPDAWAAVFGRANLSRAAGESGGHPRQPNRSEQAG